MQQLKGKRVLLIAPRFFGYELEIQREMRRRGAVVDWLADRPFDTPWQAAATRLVPSAVHKIADQFYRRALEGMAADQYDLVLVINGQTISVPTLASFRTRFPRARFVLYMWDSMENRSNSATLLDQFDTAFSFDPRSVKEYGMGFRPLFFSTGFERHSTGEFAYDLSFIGTMHTDRYEVISKVRRSLGDGIRAHWYLYLQAPWVYWAYRTVKPAMRSAKLSDFSYAPLGREEVQRVFAQSRAVIDIEHPRQFGLTMRTFETVGCGKKLITTNAQVRHYDFYDPRNVCIIDRKEPHIPPEFLSTPYVDLVPALYYKYSVAGWLDEILGLQPESDSPQRFVGKPS